MEEEEFGCGSKTGPTPRSTVLSLEQEAVVVAFRRHTLLPLDDCLYALQATIPELTRSSLHRCLQRHAISRLPDVDGDRPRRKKFKTYPIGYFHIDIAEVRTEQGKLYLLVAIDRTSKFAFVEVHEKATQRVAADFLNALIQAVPYKIHTVLTDNGVHFTTPGNRCSAAAEIKLALQRGELFRAHAFEFACAKADIDHRLTKPKHPWTKGQVERMNRTLKEATVKRFDYETHERFRQHLTDFVLAYNFAKRLKTLKGLTPYEYICALWTKEPQRFKLNPTHLSLGLNNYMQEIPESVQATVNSINRELRKSGPEKTSQTAPKKKSATAVFLGKRPSKSATSEGVFEGLTPNDTKRFGGEVASFR